MNKILIFAHDPGGANAIVPLLPYLTSYDLSVYAQGPAVSIFNIYIYIEEYKGNARELFDFTKPDLVITGTSAANMLEKELRLLAKKNNVPCISILDYWSNYGIRFSPYSTSEADLYNKNKILPYLPQYLIVMDDYAKEQSIQEGIPETIIYSLGNPHFEYIRKQKKLDVTQIRKELLQGKEKLIVFASECSIEDYGEGIEIESVIDIISILPNNYQFIIKMHPRDSKNKYDEFSQYVLKKDYSSIEVLLASDIVISKSSMLLVEGLLLDKKIISYQKHAINNKSILSQIGILPFITTKQQLENEVLNAEKQSSSYMFKENTIQNILNLIKEILCQN